MAIFKGKGGKIALTGGGAVIAAGAVALAAAARRKRVSVRGWLVSYVLVPAFWGRGKGGSGAFQLRIAESRAEGPARPGARIKSRYRFVDELDQEPRAFRLAPKDGTASAMRILYLHGGAYVLDLMALQWPIVTGLVDRTGAEVTASIYPLAPEHDVEAGLSAVTAAFERLAREVGAANVIVVGDSAGGGLALALAQRLRDAGQPQPAALVLFFPWLDVTCSGGDQPALDAREPLLDIDDLREAGRMWAGTGDPAGPAASPLFARHAGLPPTLVLVGTRDLLLSDSRRLAALNPEVTVREYPGMFHGWVCAPIPEGRRALDEAAAFAKRHVPAPPGPPFAK